jgi:hypothetical protein
MNPFFVLPGDIVKLTKDGLVDHTLTLADIKTELDDSDHFLKSSQKLPKGTILEACQIYAQARDKGPSFITFKIIDGPAATNFNKQLADSQIGDLKIQIATLESKLSAFGDLSSKARTEVIYDKKNKSTLRKKWKKRLQQIN